MKKVLFVIDSLACGGAEKSLVSLLPLLDYSAFDVDLMIMNNEGDSSVYTQDMLNTKNHAELRQIAKTYKIKLSYVLENGDRKNKTRKELIQEILEKSKE